MDDKALKNKGTDRPGRRKLLFFAVVIAVLIAGTAVIALKRPSAEVLTEHTDYTGPFGPITASSGVVERLNVERRSQTLDSISLFMGTFGRVNDCEVDFTVYKNSEEVYRYVIENAEDMRDNAYFTLSDINVDCGPYDELYLLITSPDADENNAVTVAIDEKDRERSVYSYNSLDGSADEIPGGLCASVTCSDDTLFIFSVAMFVCIVVFSAAVLYALLFTAAGLHRVFSLAVILYGLIYMFAMTPLSPPDEHTHYVTAYKLSNYLMFRGDKFEYAEADDFDFHGVEIHNNVSSGYLRVVDDLLLPDTDDAEIKLTESNKNLGFNLQLSWFQLLPQALGIALGRLTNQNFVRTFMLGRLFNLLFYAVCVYFAVKRVPKFKLLFGLVSIMPMSLHQAASYSYDCFVNGMSLLLIACVMRDIYDERPLSRPEYFRLFALSVLLAPVKVIYVCLTFLVTLIPAKCFGGKRKKLTACTVILAASFISLAVSQYAPIKATISSGSNYTEWERYNVGFILREPVETLLIFARTLSQRAFTWFQWCIGSNLSGLSLGIPEWIIAGYIMLLLLATVNVENTERPLAARERVVFFLIFAAVVGLSMLSMFVGWTHYGAREIEGVQGRYFIPALPLLFMCLNSGNIWMKKPREKLCVSSAALLQMFTVSYIVLYTCKTM